MTQNKNIEGQALLDIIRAILPSTRLTLKDLWRSLTKDNIRYIRDAIREKKSPDTIEALLHNEKSISILKMLLAQPVLNPNKLIPEGTSYKEVLKSKVPFIGKYLTEMTTLYETCIKNCSEKPEHYKEVFKFLLEQRQPKENFAELVVTLAKSSKYYPEASDELLKIMQDMNKIDLDETFLMVRKHSDKHVKDGMHNNLGQQNTQNYLYSSKELSSFSPVHSAVKLYNRSKQAQASQQANGVIMSLREFLNLVKTPFTEAIMQPQEEQMPSKSVDSPNVQAKEPQQQL